MPIKHTATDPNGVTHKRTSASRAYTHCVVALPHYEAELNAAKQVHADRKNYAYSLRCAQAAIGAPYHTDGSRSWFTVDEHMHKDGLAIIAEYPTVEQYLAGKTKQRLDAIERRRAEGFYRAYYVVGWSSRFDLALKVANGKHGAVILEAKQA